MIRMDLSTQAIEVEQNYDPDPLVILVTRDNMTPTPGGLDVTCLHRRNADNPWVRVPSGIGAITQGFRGSRHRAQEYGLIEEGEYHIRSFHEGDAQLREFYLNLRLGNRQDWMELYIDVIEAPIQSIWMFENNDPVRFDGSPLSFVTQMALAANERTQSVYVPTVETDVNRPTAWERLGELDDEP